MLIINNRFLSVYDYNFLLYYEKIFSVKQPKDQRFQDKKLITIQRIGDEERRLMHLVPAPAVKLMKSRVLSRPGMKKCLGSYLN